MGYLKAIEIQQAQHAATILTRPSTQLDHSEIAKLYLETMESDEQDRSAWHILVSFLSATVSR